MARASVDSARVPERLCCKCGTYGSYGDWRGRLQRWGSVLCRIPWGMVAREGSVVNRNRLLSEKSNGRGPSWDQVCGEKNRTLL